MPNLSDKCVLANFSVSRWGGHRFDRGATAEVHAAKGADQDSGNYNKRLLPKGSSAKIDAVVNAARDYHRRVTLPWLDGGVRILPSTNYMDYAKEMQDFRRAFEQEVAAFFKLYPELQKQAQKKLKALFNQADYPTITELKRFYQWDLLIQPFPSDKDFRVEVPDLGRLQADLKSRMDQVYKEAMADVGARILEEVGHMAERLKAYKPGKPGERRAQGMFRESMISNVSALVDILPSLNLEDDPKLTKIIATMKKDLCGHDVEDLRLDGKLRKKVAASADQVLSAINDFIA